MCHHCVIKNVNIQHMLMQRGWMDLEMRPQWVTGLETVIGQCPCSRRDIASLESLCSTTGATQNSKGYHLLSIRWSHNTLCMHLLYVCVCVCVIVWVCAAILMCKYFLCVDHRWPSGP